MQHDEGASVFGYGDAPRDGHGTADAVAAGDTVPAGAAVDGSVRRALQARIAVVAFSLVASVTLALVLSTVLGTAG